MHLGLRVAKASSGGKAKALSGGMAEAHTAGLKNINDVKKAFAQAAALA